MTVNNKPATGEVIELGCASFTLPGQTESGDMYVVKQFDDGMLVGVVDGLGHGGEAAAAAKAAVYVLEKYAHESVISLLRRSHEALKTTRGVVMSIASFNTMENTMTWLSVGNVEGVLLRADRTTVPNREIILLRGGVVGYQLPQPFAVMHSVAKGDTLIFATDGIRSGFYDMLPLPDAPQRAADKICMQLSKKNDDALVLVVKYLGKKLP
ncbi:MAG: SpoIIE family protein phosphatase [Bacteroidota bacterium]|nr:SpoIIE family protein phosphatase [Bacteroidota bacterium]